ncbi:hypothetical protein F4703DRAFT_1832690 [Phycomyces blakesleeanus]
MYNIIIRWLITSPTGPFPFSLLIFSSKWCQTFTLLTKYKYKNNSHFYSYSYSPFCSMPLTTPIFTHSTALHYTHYTHNKQKRNCMYI